MTTVWTNLPLPKLCPPDINPADLPHSRTSCVLRNASSLPRRSTTSKTCGIRAICRSVFAVLGRHSKATTTSWRCAQFPPATIEAASHYSCEIRASIICARAAREHWYRARCTPVLLSFGAPYVVLCFALLCFALLCFALLCFAFALLSSRSVSFEKRGAFDARLSLYLNVFF